MGSFIKFQMIILASTLIFLQSSQSTADNCDPNTALASAISQISVASEIKIRSGVEKKYSIQSRILSGSIKPEMYAGKEAKAAGYVPFPSECFDEGSWGERVVDKNCVLINFEKWWEDNGFPDGKHPALLKFFLYGKSSLAKGVQDQKGPTCAITTMAIAMGKDADRLKEIYANLVVYNGKVIERSELPSGKRFGYVPCMSSSSGGGGLWGDENGKKCDEAVAKKFGYKISWIGGKKDWPDDIVHTVVAQKKPVLLTVAWGRKNKPVPPDDKSRIGYHQVMLKGVVSYTDGSENAIIYNPNGKYEEIPLELLKKSYVAGSAFTLDR